jgi:hypothetical protein
MLAKLHGSQKDNFASMQWVPSNIHLCKPSICCQKNREWSQPNKQQQLAAEETAKAQNSTGINQHSQGDAHKVSY